MGCCASIPSNDEGETGLNSTSAATTNNNQQIQTQAQTQQPSSIQIKKPEVTITRASSSLHSQSNFEKTSSQEIDNNSSVTSSNAASAAKSTTTTSTWPISVRPNKGPDITFQVPTQPPFLTVSNLRRDLLTHLEANDCVKLIFLGKILPDQHYIVPAQMDADLPNKNVIQIQKEGVIQAMVTKKP